MAPVPGIVRRLGPLLKPLAEASRRAQSRATALELRGRIALAAPGHWGDLIIALPLLASLCRPHGERDWELWLHPDALPLARSILRDVRIRPWLPAWFPDGRGDVFGRWRPPAEGRYDGLIDWRGELQSALMLRGVRARWRLGIDEFGAAPFYCRSTRVFEDQPQAKNLWDSLRWLKGDPESLPEADLRPWLGDPRADTGPVVIAPAAGSQAKTWPHRHWQSLCEDLRGQGLRLRFVGAAQDAPELRAEAGDEDWRGHFSGGQAFQSLASCRAVVCQDSYYGHLAAALSLPLVSIFSAANSVKRWGPRGPGVMRILFEPPDCAGCRRRVCEHRRCLEAIHPRAVSDALAALLVRNLPASSGCEAPFSAESEHERSK